MTKKQLIKAIIKEHREFMEASTTGWGKPHIINSDIRRMWHYNKMRYWQNELGKLK